MSERPKTRAECPKHRPCPWVSCRYHLALDVRRDGRLSFFDDALEHDPARVLEAMPYTCALDVAEAGDHHLEEIGGYLGLSKERVRVLEASAMAALKEGIATRAPQLRPEPSRRGSVEDAAATLESDSAAALLERLTCALGRPIRLAELATATGESAQGLSFTMRRAAEAGQVVLYEGASRRVGIILYARRRPRSRWHRAWCEAARALTLTQLAIWDVLKGSGGRLTLPELARLCGMERRRVVRSLGSQEGGIIGFDDLFAWCVTDLV